MILFCDTSALMKVFAYEEHSEAMCRWMDRADACIVSRITWAEMCAAFGLKRRTLQLTESEATIGLDRLHQEWQNYALVEVNARLVNDAGNLAQRFGLRAYDSVQLASAQHALDQVGAAFTFCCFDKKLTAAAVALGIPIAQP